jgi:hypothetical protein
MVCFRRFARKLSAAPPRDGANFGISRISADFGDAYINPQFKASPTSALCGKGPRFQGGRRGRSSLNKGIMQVSP